MYNVKKNNFFFLPTNKINFFFYYLIDKPILNIESLYEIREGQNANIICEIDSNPTYSIVTWYFNKQQLITPFTDVSAELSVSKLLTTGSQVEALDFSFTDFSFVQYTNRSVLRINSVRNSYNNAVVQCVVGNDIYTPESGYSQQFTSEISTKLSVLCKRIQTKKKRFFKIYLF
jgi:hypothetical protein